MEHVSKAAYIHKIYIVHYPNYADITVSHKTVNELMLPFKLLFHLVFMGSLSSHMVGDLFIISTYRSAYRRPVFEVPKPHEGKI